MNSLPPNEYATLPKLNAPAGYICVLRDIDRDVYRIDSTDHPAIYVYTLLSGAASTFGVELVSILESGDLNVSKSELYEHYGATLGAEWFELDPYQLQELRDSRLQINAYESCYLIEQSVQAESTVINHPYLEKNERESLPKLEAPAGYVYLLQDVDVTGYFKIGYTNNPERRLNDFGVELPFKTEVVDIIETDDARSLERELHRRYAGKRRKGEWFDLNAAEVKAIRNLETGVSTPSYYAASQSYALHSNSGNQYVGQLEQADVYGVESWQNPTAENKKKLTWKAGCLYLFLILFAANLLGGFDLNSSSRRSSSSARLNRSAVRATTSSVNRAAVSTANRASTATYYVKTSDSFPANVRLCPRTTANCRVIDHLLPGEAVRQLERVAGEAIHGNENWIRFRHIGRNAYIHTGVLSSSRVSTPTFYVATLNNKSAAVRSCPRTTADCAVISGKLPGDEVHPQEAVTGERVNGSVVWFKIRHNGKTAYIHSSLVTASR